MSAFSAESPTQTGNLPRVDRPGDRLRRIVVRLHATCLFVITLTALTFSSIGWQGSGPYQVLADQGWGYIGLYQAYLLMFLLATITWIGSVRWGGAIWNALLLAAELVPFSVIFIARSVFDATDQQDKATAGIIIHVVFISLETFALLWRKFPRS